MESSNSSNVDGSSTTSWMSVKVKTEPESGNKLSSPPKAPVIYSPCPHVLSLPQILQTKYNMCKEPV